MKTVYFDMDGVLADFEKGKLNVTQEQLDETGGEYDEVPGFYGKLEPIEGALEAFKKIQSRDDFDAYILSTAPWKNHTAWSDKLLWVHRYLPELAHKRLILSHHKNLLMGDYLIDDRIKHGSEKFEGEHIHFRSDRFPDWDSVLNYLL